MRRAAKLEFVSIDMSAAYEAAIKKNAPNSVIVFDRFHTQRLAHDALASRTVAPRSVP